MSWTGLLASTPSHRRVRAGTGFAGTSGMGGRAAVAVALVAWLALACGRPHPLACLAAGGAALVGLALASRAPRRVGAVLVLAALAAAAFGRGGATRLLWDARREGLPADGAIVRARVELLEPAREESGEPVARVRVRAARPQLAAGTQLRLRFPSGFTAVPGRSVDVVARIDRFTVARQPGGHDALASGAAAGVVASGRAFTARAVAPGPLRRIVDAWSVHAVAAHARRAIEESCARALSPRAREWVVPLLLGDRSGMSPETDAQLRGAGLVHLLALSGLHVTWLAALVRAIAAWAGAGVRTRALFGAFAAAAYALVAGPFPSLMRAVAAECSGAAARVAGRALDPLQALGLAALALLLARPGWAADLGFQLSCAATLGLLALAPREPPPRGARAVLAVVWAPLAITAGAQLATLPLLVARFHALPWAGLVANLVAVPLAEGLLAGGLLLVLAESVAPGAGHVWASACEGLVAALARVAALAARLPGAQLGVGAEPGLPWLFALGVAGLVLARAGLPTLAARARGPSRGCAWSALLGCALLAAGLLAALTARPLRPAPGHAWVVALDVGQGDALALAAGDAWGLVDAGPRQPRGDAGDSVVLPFLRWAGVRTIAALTLTHDDGDHVGGASAVQRGVNVERIVAAVPLPGVPGPAARHPGATVLARGDTIRIGAARAVVRWPPRAGPDAALARRGDNAASLVLEVESGRQRVLLTGDADSLVEDRLEVGGRLALLKAGHHGSGSSTGVKFLARVRPAWVVLSAGRRNPHGHPAPAVLARIAAAGATALRTDHSGTLWLECGPGGVRPLDWRRGMRRGHAPGGGPGPAVR